jgi:hypothetical protein
MGKLVETSQGNYVISDPAPGSLANEQDLLDLIAHCVNPDSHRLLIRKGTLHPDFFDLSTGLAGKLALKLSSYRIKTAIVVDLDSVPSQRFKEWAWECNRGKEIHFCTHKGEAAEWLLHR